MALGRAGGPLPRHPRPHREEGETVLRELLPEQVERVLDLGCGDGRLLALVRDARPGCRGVALDFSPEMLDAARARFAGDPLRWSPTTSTAPCRSWAAST